MIKKTVHHVKKIVKKPDGKSLITHNDDGRMLLELVKKKLEPPPPKDMEFSMIKDADGNQVGFRAKGIG